MKTDQLNPLTQQLQAWHFLGIAVCCERHQGVTPGSQPTWKSWATSQAWKLPGELKFWKIWVAGAEPDTLKEPAMTGGALLEPCRLATCPSGSFRCMGL